MRVRLVAHTVFNDLIVSDLMSWNDTDVDGHPDADMLAELAGRLCYRSFDRPNRATAQNVDYVANIVRQQHFSVLEHASVTFLVEDVSRTLTHELVRHRHLSFSQVSQRYVDEHDAPVVIPELLRDADDDDGRWLRDMLVSTQRLGHQLYARVDAYARVHGHSRKAARGAARAALLGSTTTALVVTGNVRAWREFLRRRWHVAADVEIRRLAGLLRGELIQLAPASFADVPDEPYGGDE